MRAARGFTLIELLVVMSIIAIVLAFTTASYRSFQTNQALSQAGKTLTTNLRFAQSQAFSGVKNCGNEELIGWYAHFNPNSYVINARCGATSITLGSSPRTVILESGITLTVAPSSDILFQPVNKEAVFIGNAATQNPPFSSVGPEVTITLTKEGKTFVVTVRKTGDVQ